MSFANSGREGKGSRPSPPPRNQDTDTPVPEYNPRKQYDAAGKYAGKTEAFAEASAWLDALPDTIQRRQAAQVWQQLAELTRHSGEELEVHQAFRAYLDRRGWRLTAPEVADICK